MVDGTGRLDHWEYPAEAVREIVVNALTHRDYNPLAHGAQIRMELYPDRLKVTSPGGLHALAHSADLLAEPFTSSRNTRLAKLLEDVEVPSTGRTVCENRGTGLLAVAAVLRRADQPPLEFTDRVRDFSVTIRSAAVAGRPPESPHGAGTTRNPHPGRHPIRVVAAEAPPTTTAAEPDPADQARTPSTKSTSRPKRHVAKPDPAEQIRGLLAAADAVSCSSLAAALGMSRQAALKWLHKLENAGEVEPTHPHRRSPLNQWRLTSTPD